MFLAAISPPLLGAVWPNHSAIVSRPVGGFSGRSSPCGRSRAIRLTHYRPVRSQLRLGLLQTEPHVHLAVHRRGGGEVLLGLLAACPCAGRACRGRGGSGRSAGACRAREPGSSRSGSAPRLFPRRGDRAARPPRRGDGGRRPRGRPACACRARSRACLPSRAASSICPVASATSPSGMAPSRWSETSFIEAAWSATLRSRGMASVGRLASAYAAPRDAAIPWNLSAVNPKVWQTCRPRSSGGMAAGAFPCRT